MPVLLIAIVTSPSSRSCPALTFSSDGSELATHRSCAGLVYTAMLGLLRDTVGVEDMIQVAVVLEMLIFLG